MATLLSHPAVPLEFGVGLGQRVIPMGLLLAAIVATLLPDLDVIAFHFGVPYDSPFGHRGFTHSFAFAALIGFIGSIFSRPCKIQVSAQYR
ncbi:MAG: metal-dependent hydrolase [Burkholderiales bacterium]